MSLTLACRGEPRTARNQRESVAGTPSSPTQRRKGSADAVHNFKWQCDRYLSGTGVKKTTFFLVVAAVVIFASGCRNGAVEGCTAPQGPSLLYPRPGATGIADTRLVLWFGSNGDPSPFYSRPVIAPNG